MLSSSIIYEPQIMQLDSASIRTTSKENLRKEVRLRTLVSGELGQYIVYSMMAHMQYMISLFSEW